MTPDVDAARPTRRRLLTWGLPVLAVAGAVVVAGVVLRHSADDAADAGERTATSRSSTIAWADDGGSLWVTSPDDDRVVEVDPDSLEVDRQVQVDGQPRELTVLDHRLVVTGAQSTDLAVVDLDPVPGDASTPGQPDVGSIPLPCGGSRGVVTVPAAQGGPAVDLALVTCPTDDRIAVVDLERGRSVGYVTLSGRPTGIVREGGVVTVSTAGDGRLHAFPVAAIVASLPVQGAKGPAEALEVEPTSSRRAWTDGGRTASTLAALDAGPRGPIGVYQVVDNQRRLSRAEIETGSTYGSPKDGRARLEPAIAGACGARFTSLTDEARRLSGPVALAVAPQGDLIWVIGEFSHSVSVVRCDGGPSSGTSATVASFTVGEGARGIVLADDGRRAYVDVGFDHQVAELRLPAAAADVGATGEIERGDPAEVGRRKVDDRYLSPLAQQGRRMFNDGTNTHLTPFGVVTCGSCHPSAGEDGLDWRIERVDASTKEIERKVRRTPAAWQVDPAVKPLHWDGEFDSSDDLALTTIQQLLGGDGLLIDTAAISAYMAEVDAPPTQPAGDPKVSALVTLSGLNALNQAGCTTCHIDDAGTDGKAHDVLSPSTAADGGLAAVITPPLRSVRGRAPYGHDGRAPTLEALLAQHGDGKGGTITLTPQERKAILAYLDSR